ncbi:MAG: hypothetical protein QOG86_2354 [Thermoleophilaceae bacterium]|nr:hypothetical protein [Thermoleophilaceae bacterium]MEA2351413.1 hypothetical protein [Thermoleophilaceae bacterium]MEA2352349.1 hypothetical protein [Thermoleophilaceae bacterium]
MLRDTLPFRDGSARCTIRAMDALSVIATKIPYPAGLIFSAAITAVGCVVFVIVQTAVRGDTIEWENALGGVIVAVVLGVLGLLLVAVGAPAFK